MTLGALVSRWDAGKPRERGGWRWGRDWTDSVLRARQHWMVLGIQRKSCFPEPHPDLGVGRRAHRLWDR